MASYSIVKVDLSTIFKADLIFDFSRPDTDIIDVAVPPGYVAVMLQNDSFLEYPHIQSGKFMVPWGDCADKLLEDSAIFTTLPAGEAYAVSCNSKNPKLTLTSQVVPTPGVTTLAALVTGNQNMVICVNDPVNHNTGISYEAIHSLSGWFRELLAAAV